MAVEQWDTLPPSMTQLELSFKQTRKRFSKEEEELIRSAAKWCKSSGNTYSDMAAALSLIMPHPSGSIRMKMSRLVPAQKNRRKRGNRK